MSSREHCAKCDRPLGKHHFVSDDGQRILCGRCAGHRSLKDEDVSVSRSKLLISARRH